MGIHVYTYTRIRVRLYTSIRIRIYEYMYMRVNIQPSTEAHVKCWWWHNIRTDTKEGSWVRDVLDCGGRGAARIHPPTWGSVAHHHVSDARQCPSVYVLRTNVCAASVFLCPRTGPAGDGEWGGGSGIPQHTNPTTRARFWFKEQKCVNTGSPCLDGGGGGAQNDRHNTLIILREKSWGICFQLFVVRAALRPEPGLVLRRPLHKGSARGAPPPPQTPCSTSPEKAQLLSPVGFRRHIPHARMLRLWVPYKSLRFAKY